MPQYYLKRSYAENLCLKSKPKLAAGSLLFPKNSATFIASLFIDDLIEVELSASEAKIFKLLNGKKSLKEIAGELDFSNEYVLDSISNWEDKCAGIFTYPEDQNFLKRAKVADVAASLLNRANGERSLTRGEELSEYHKKGMSGRAHEQFEHVETTVSHLYRKPREALEGRAFGEALADTFFDKVFFKKCLSSKAILEDEKFEILEVGAGTGLLTKAFLERFRSLGILEKVNYTILDPSPNLLISQKKQLSNFQNIQFIEMPIEESNLPKNSFDLILSNEVIADFSVGRVSKGPSSLLEKKLPEDLKAEAQKEKYELETKSKLELINTGAIEFIEQIATMLKPGGHAYISEYGGLSRAPVQLSLDGHNEHSIHFNNLEKAAKVLGLSASISGLVDYLGFDKNVKILCDLSFAALNDILLPKLDRARLERKAYSENELKSELGDVVGQVQNLRFDEIISKKNLGPALFYVLELSK